MAHELRKSSILRFEQGVAENVGASLRLRPHPDPHHHEQDQAPACGRLLGTSAALRLILEQIEVVAPADVPVVIFGETGVGKELVARAIHERSLRCAHPLVKVNCTAIPGGLFECEFFGHLKGAFTGAVKNRIGRFQLADRGTLFLDEVGDLPPEIQPKLLRVLQDGEFEAVGDVDTRRVDVRVIAASNRDLADMVKAGRFREDLYYRLCVFPIEVPPLREREGDIAILARYFLKQACKRFDREEVQLTDEQIDRLSRYAWPGNVRELRNVMERAVISARGECLRLELPGAGRSLCPADARVGVVPEEELKRKERDNLRAALARSRGKIYGPGGAAELLGIKPTTLCSRIKKLGINRDPSRQDCD